MSQSPSSGCRRKIDTKPPLYLATARESTVWVGPRRRQTSSRCESARASVPLPGKGSLRPGSPDTSSSVTGALARFDDLLPSKVPCEYGLSFFLSEVRLMGDALNCHAVLMTRPAPLPPSAPRCPHRRGRGSLCRRTPCAHRGAEQANVRTPVCSRGQTAGHR